MNVYHPLNSIPGGWPTWVTFATWLVLFLVTGMLATPDLDAPGVSEENRKVLALERPANEKTAHDVIAEWDKAGKLGEVRRQLRFDNIFILAYSTLTALGCVIA